MNIYSLVIDPMKLIYGLQSTNKSFTVLFYPSWRGNHYQTFLHQLQQKIHHHHHYEHLASTYNRKVIFKVVVSVGTDVEDYCIDHLRVLNLPVIVLYSNGGISSIIELQQLKLNSNNRDTFHEQAVSLKDFISYPNESSVDYTRIINELYNHHMDSITLHHHHLSYHPHHHHNNSSNSMKLFVSGDRSSVGKSSICLAILATLLRKGFSPSSLAYIKPVTQCEAEQPITRFCNRNGISNRGIGPVVFYKGFTRAFLSNETHSSDVMMEQIDEAVQVISRGKLITIVDGVGYPSVGSICNISNAQVAKKLNCPVLLIGKSGVGDAVDSYNLNSTYFSSYQVKVLGGIFNKIPLDGYYSLEYCCAAITSYFQQYRSYEMPYGYIPILQDDDDASSNENLFIQECHGVNHDITKNDHSDYRNDYNISGTKDTIQSKLNINLQHMNKKRSSKLQLTSFEWKLSDAFIEHVDIQRLMHDLWCYELTKIAEETVTTDEHRINSQMQIPSRLSQQMHTSQIDVLTNELPMVIEASIEGTKAATISPSFRSSSRSNSSCNDTVGNKRDRASIEQEASMNGAKGG